MERARIGISLASTITSAGFQAARYGTNFGFGIARDISSTVALGAGTLIDYVFTGGKTDAGAALESMVSSAFGVAESVAIGTIMFGERIASVSIATAQDSIDLLSGLFGNDEASFSLAAFVQLVRREWSNPSMADHLPEERYSLLAMMQALMAWAAVQNVTHFHSEINWFQHLRELSPAEIEENMFSTSILEENSHVQVTEDTLLPEDSGQIISAEIGEAGNTSKTKVSSCRQPLITLRRLLKLVLAGHGGASMMFFGMPLRHTPPKRTNEGFPPPETIRSGEEALVKDIASSMEKRAAETVAYSKSETSTVHNFSWWNVLLGKHDQEIFESYAFGSNDLSSETKATAMIGSEVNMPRFWVITDHSRKEIVLVLRGTFSLNELAVDLTCDPAPFSPGDTRDPTSSDVSHEAGGSSIPSYEVHGGMLKLARAMGSSGRPVHRAVKKALSENEGYDLILCGHSLGAGIAALFALMWADLETCLTVKSSDLPPGHRVTGYLFAPPCLVSKELSVKCKSLLMSFVYSHDVVSRLSLGSVRNLTRATMWLCTGKGKERPLTIVRRAVDLQRERVADSTSRKEEISWFLSLRKTLEANMNMAHLFPPGRVLWALDDQDLQPSFRSNHDAEKNKVRLFEVREVDKIFGQIIFSRRMLGSHMPHQYERALGHLVSQ